MIKIRHRDFLPIIEEVCVLCVCGRRNSTTKWRSRGHLLFWHVWVLFLWDYITLTDRKSFFFKQWWLIWGSMHHLWGVLMGCPSKPKASLADVCLLLDPFPLILVQASWGFCPGRLGVMCLESRNKLGSNCVSDHDTVCNVKRKWELEEHSAAWVEPLSFYFCSFSQLKPMSFQKHENGCHLLPCVSWSFIDSSRSLRTYCTSPGRWKRMDAQVKKYMV